MMDHDVEHESRKIYDGADFKELSEIYIKNDKIKTRLGIVYLINIKILLDKFKLSIVKLTFFNRGIGQDNQSTSH